MDDYYDKDRLEDLRDNDEERHIGASPFDEELEKDLIDLQEWEAKEKEDE